MRDACIAERDGEMHVLDMGNNSISKDGAKALADYMAKSKTLKELNLYMNDIGTAGITDVRLAMPTAWCSTAHDQSHLT